MKVAYKINGRTVSREEFMRGAKGLEGGAPMIAPPSNWPMVSMAAAVDPSQAAEYNEFYKQNGITGARHRPDGMLELDTRGARREMLRARGLHDNDGGFGD
ncbi:MAG: hypothetical protein V1755_06455 [Chloroflexota bacterium]